MTAGQELIFYIGTYGSEEENRIHWGRWTGVQASFVS